MNGTDQPTKADAIEAALIQGDLGKLTPDQRVAYYVRVCESLGLNHVTRPFDYIVLNNKLTLYARKDAADQLRKKHGVSIAEPTIRFEGDWIVVSVAARLPDGRTDADVRVVSKKDMRGDFGNALMKAVTKAKRRVTLSICGLGMLDETEVESAAGAPAALPEHQPAGRTAPQSPPPPPAAPESDAAEPDRPEVGDVQQMQWLLRSKGQAWQQVVAWMNAHCRAEYSSTRTAFGQISVDHRRRLVAHLLTLPDAAPAKQPT